MPSTQYEFFSDSNVVSSVEPLLLEGVWLHDPADPDDTARQYRYGKNNKGREVDMKNSELFFAGREFPIYEFGEHSTDTIEVSIILPTGEEYFEELAFLYKLLRVRRPIHYRDNRGRVMMGVVNGVSDSDQDVGSEVSVRFNRINWDPPVEVML